MSYAQEHALLMRDGHALYQHLWLCLPKGTDTAALIVALGMSYEHIAIEDPGAAAAVIESLEVLKASLMRKAAGVKPGDLN